MTECLQLNLPVSRIGGVAMTFHQGIDLRTSFEPVYAVMDGTVGKAGYYQHSGFYIPMIHSPLFMTSNAHLSDIKVREGAIIMRVGIVNRRLYTKKAASQYQLLCIINAENYLNFVMIKQPINATRFITATCKTIFLICSIVMYSFTNAQNKGIHFDDNTNWKGILAKAKAENKYIFVDCFTTWCGPCKYMSNNIFPMEEVGNFYNDKFINVAMQFDSTINDAENIKARYADAVFIDKEYKINGYPTFLFFSPDGELLHRKWGGGDAKQFITIGTNALDPEKQYYTQIKKYNAGQRDSTFLNNLIFMALAVDDSLAEKYAKESYATLNDANKIKLHNRLKYTIINEELKSTGGLVNLEKWDDNQWYIYANKIRKTYPLFAEDVLLYFKIRVYQTKENWGEYTATVKEYTKNKSVSSDELDNCAWLVFANCNDNKILNQALQWSKQSFTNQERIDPNFMGTYANLLYKLGRKKEAIEWEQKAQKIVIEQGGEKSWGQDFIDKVNKGEKTW